MVEIITFAECLKKLMNKHQLSSANLATMIGSRSDLKRVLADEASESKRRQMYDRLIALGVFSAQDYQALEHSLEVSRMGIDRYQFAQSVSSIFTGIPSSLTKEICTDTGIPLHERLRVLENAHKISIICLNSCFHSMISSLVPLFEDKNRDIHMKHLIHSEAYANAAADYVSVALPLLFDQRYEPYVMDKAMPSHSKATGGNMIAIQALTSSGPVELFFATSSNGVAYELPNAVSCGIFNYISNVLTALHPEPQPLREPLPPNEDFPSLCMTFLSHELNRATYSIFGDLCFEQIPCDIAMAALQDKGMFSDEETARIIQRTLSIHEQRFRNMYGKKKPSYHVMTLEGCERFLETGLSTDHFVGFRAFTPDERKRIFAEMLSAARNNPAFIPLLLKERNFQYRYNLVCYDKLGVSLDEKDTDYDLNKGYRSIFLMFPTFTQQYAAYFMETIVKELCLNKEDSLHELERMFSAFLVKYQLDA